MLKPGGENIQVASGKPGKGKERAENRDVRTKKKSKEGGTRGKTVGKTLRRGHLFLHRTSGK